jgi:hypothetical protein
MLNIDLGPLLDNLSEYNKKRNWINPISQHSKHIQQTKRVFTQPDEKRAQNENTERKEKFLKHSLLKNQLYIEQNIFRQHYCQRHELRLDDS